MAAKKKSKAKKRLIKIMMRSSESRYFYTTVKPSANREKLKFRRYDPVVRKHVLFQEEKLK